MEKMLTTKPTTQIVSKDDNNSKENLKFIAKNEEKSPTSSRRGVLNQVHTYHIYSKQIH